jgi:hypothetical protein
MPDRRKGLITRYDVERIDGEPLKGDRAIVLEVGDPNSWPALMTWADTVENDGYVQLAHDIRGLVGDHKERMRDGRG